MSSVNFYQWFLLEMRFEITCFFTHIRMTVQTVPYLYHIHKRTAVWGLGCHLFFIVHLHNCKMAKMAVVTNPIEMMCLTTPAEMESCGWGARHSYGSWNREALEPNEHLDLRRLQTGPGLGPGPGPDKRVNGPPAFSVDRPAHHAGERCFSLQSRIKTHAFMTVLWGSVRLSAVHLSLSI